MSENDYKTQRKQTKDKSVFLRFGNQICRRAGNYRPQTARSRRPLSVGGRKIRAEDVVVKILAAGCDGEFVNGIRQSALPTLRDGVVDGIAERTCHNSNAHHASTLPSLMTLVGVGVFFLRFKTKSISP